MGESEMSGISVMVWSADVGAARGVRGVSPGGMERPEGTEEGGHRIGEVAQANIVKHIQWGRNVVFVWTILLTAPNMRRHPFLILTTLLPVRSSSFLSLTRVSTGQ